MGNVAFSVRHDLRNSGRHLLSHATNSSFIRYLSSELADCKTRTEKNESSCSSQPSDLLRTAGEAASATCAKETKKVGSEDRGTGDTDSVFDGIDLGVIGRNGSRCPSEDPQGHCKTLTLRSSSTRHPSLRGTQSAHRGEDMSET